MSPRWVRLPPAIRWVAMQNSSTPSAEAYEWHPRFVLLPRIGKVMDRPGLHTRLILPGDYYARRSRTLGHWIYRQSHQSYPPPPGRAETGRASSRDSVCLDVERPRVAES